MSSAAYSDWPSYPVGPGQHIHALGVVAINFNVLEALLHVLTRRYLGTADEVHAYIFKVLNLNSRLELFKLTVEKQEPDKTVVAHLAHFIKCYAACAENRNFLMHADVDELESTEQILAIEKRSKNRPHIFNNLALSLPALRKIADDIRRVYVYGAVLIGKLEKRDRTPHNALITRFPPLPALPEKCEIPKGLLEPPPAKKRRPRAQPRSSQA